MILKTRTESLELLINRYAYIRDKLSDHEVTFYRTLEKGYEGELKFDALIEKLQGECIVLNDLLFEVNNTLFQIDTLVITSDSLYIIDIKIHEGDYYVDSSGRWFTISKAEIKNPIHQLNRCESMFKKLLQKMGFTTTIVSNLIFVNPHFYLYQAPLHLPIIFPCQIDRFLTNLEQKVKSDIKLKERHYKLVNQLLSHHITESPYLRKPQYTYEGLKKGIYCKVCHSFDVESNTKTVVCTQCGKKEKIEEAVLRHVKEFSILFPDLKVTTSIILEWCNNLKSPKTIRRILAKNFNSLEKTKGNYYWDESE